jgi:hypothetical protein
VSGPETPQQGKPPADAPEPDTDRDNAEQDETGSQAQDVAQDALRRPYRDDGETEHGGKTNPAQIIPDDAQDLVDHMTDMERSGRIDMDAFDGEESMDDEDGSVPETGEPARRSREP